MISRCERLEDVSRRGRVTEGSCVFQVPSYELDGCPRRSRGMPNHRHSLPATRHSPVTELALSPKTYGTYDCTPASNIVEVLKFLGIARFSRPRESS